MNFFKSISIEKKLIFVIVFVSCLSLVIGFTFVVLQDIYLLKEEIVNDLIKDVMVVRQSCLDSYESDDSLQTRRIIKDLAYILPLDTICIFSKDSTLFACYPAKIEQCFNRTPAFPKKHYFRKNHLYLQEPLDSKNQDAGFIHVVASTTMLQQKIRGYFCTTSLFLIVVIFISFFIAKKVSNVISRPLIELSNACKNVSHGPDYSVRVNVENQDEIGILSTEFNKMLEKIQKQEIVRDRAEQELKDNERFLHSVFDSIQDDMCIIDNEWNILKINAWMAQKFTDHKTFVGKKCFQVFQNKTQPCSWCPAKKTLQDGKINRGKVAFSAHNKLPGWRDMTCYPRIKNDDNAEGAIVYIKDISAQEAIENDLRREKEKIEQVAQTVGTGITIISKDYRIVWANRVMKDLFGDVMGRPCCFKTDITLDTCLECSVKQVLKQDLDKVAQDQIRISITGEKIWTQVITTPIRDEDGKITAAMEVIVPITERKKMEQALKESEEKYRTLFDASTDAIFLESLTGEILDCNLAACRMYKAEKENLIGLNVRDLLTEEYANELSQVLDIEQMYKGLFLDIENRRMDGQIFPVEVNTRITKVGGAESIIAYIRDVTQQKEAEKEIRKLNAELEKRVQLRTEQLAAANKELESFSYSVSHDLRTPLRAIDGYSEILLKKYSQKFDRSGREKLSVIRQQVMQMNMLIEDLLNFSRMNRTAMKLQTINFYKMVQDIVRSFTAQLDDERDIEFRISSLPNGYGDPTLIRQVLANLIDNAIKFTRENEKTLIEIGHRKENEQQVYVVKDNGVGFNMKYADNLFGVFQRLHTSEQFEGTGVGLATVERIIHRHGGNIWAEAKVNKGAAFYFSLPCEHKRKEQNCGIGSKIEKNELCI